MCHFIFSILYKILNMIQKCRLLGWRDQLGAGWKFNLLANLVVVICKPFV